MSARGLSIDVDSVASHLEGYGFDAVEDDGAAYRIAVPRLLELLERHGARATFFLVADEARRHPEVVRRIVAAGHEVASHTMTHRLPFSGLDRDALRLEVSGSKVLLDALAGQTTVGFRAPTWDVGPELAAAVAEAGYLYDSSAFPSPLLPMLRLSIRLRSRDRRPPATGVRWREIVRPAAIHVRTTPSGPLVEVPMCTAPGLRIPYYHTLRLLLPGPVFGVVRGLAERRRTVWYQLHAVDVLGLDEDELDPRIARHPGMRRPLAERLDLADRAVGELARRGPVVPLAELVAVAVAPADRTRDRGPAPQRRSTRPPAPTVAPTPPV